MAEKACKFVGMDIKKSRIITCHLGNGSSITAIKNGESIDTSMGFTPVEGVVMGTRVGNLDVGAVTFIQEKENHRESELIHKTERDALFGFLNLKVNFIYL